MNTFIYIGAFFLIVGWIVLFIVSLSDQFDDDNQKMPRRKPLAKTNLDNISETSNPQPR